MLKELEELRSMLAQPTPSMTTATSGAAPSFSSLSAPLLLPASAAYTPGFTTPSWNTPLSTFRTAPAEAAGTTAAAAPYLVKGSSSPGRLGGLAAPLVPRLDLRSCVTERLGRALCAAEEEVDAAMARQADMLSSQLRGRELDLSEAQRTAAAAAAEVAALRSQLAAARQAAAAEAAAMETQLAAKEAEVSAAHAKLLAVRAEADDLRQRLADGQDALHRADVALSSHTNDLSRRLQAAAADAEAAAEAAARERQHKEAVLVQLSDARAQLSALQEQLDAAEQELREAHKQAALDAESRHQLESAVSRAAAAAATLKEAKDLEISELRQRLRAERGVRKACEAWLQSELKSREEMEGVLQAVRDMAAAAAHTTSRHPPAARPGLSGSNSSRAKARGSSSSGDGGSSTAVAATAVADAADVARVEVLLAQLCGEEADGTAAVQQQQRQRRQQGRTLARLPAAVGSSAQAAAGAAVGSAAGSMGGLLAGEAAANRARKEFVEMKAALCADSRRLKNELEAAKQTLRTRMAARSSRQQAGDTPCSSSSDQQ